VGVGGSTIYRTKRRFVLGNLEAALSEEASRKLSGKEEALLVATACSGPPAGRARWTLELLADELVRLGSRSPWRQLTRAEGEGSAAAGYQDAVNRSRCAPRLRIPRDRPIVEPRRLHVGFNKWRQR
jgi:hypothetical protein